MPTNDTHKRKLTTTTTTATNEGDKIKAAAEVNDLMTDSAGRAQRQRRLVDDSIGGGGVVCDEGPQR